MLSPVALTKENKTKACSTVLRLLDKYKKHETLFIYFLFKKIQYWRIDKPSDYDITIRKTKSALRKSRKYKCIYNGRSSVVRVIKMGDREKREKDFKDKSLK